MALLDRQGVGAGHTPLSDLYTFASEIPAGLLVYWVDEDDHNKNMGRTVTPDVARSWNHYGSVMSHWRERGHLPAQPVWAIWNRQGDMSLDEDGKPFDPEHTWRQPSGWMPFNSLFIEGRRAFCPECEQESVVTDDDYICMVCRERGKR